MEHNVKLTSAEMAVLWSSYMNDSLSVCVFSQFLQHVDDDDIRPVVEHALSLCQRHIQSYRQLLTKENFPIPVGFTDEDVNLGAPRLYSDAFYLKYIDGMAMVGMTSASAALAGATRDDVREMYTSLLMESVALHNTAIPILLDKGIYVRAPIISTPSQVDFVKKQNFLTGFFGERRPLNAIEITNLNINIFRNCLGEALLLGFAQTAQSKKVRQYMERGKDISTKHIKVFSDILSHDDLPPAVSWATDVSNSTTHTFSDKLMMFHVAALTGAGVGNYGIAIGTSPRRDLGAAFLRLQGEVMLYGEDGAEIAIENGWLEQPPMADDRTELARHK